MQSHLEAAEVEVKFNFTYHYSDNSDISGGGGYSTGAPVPMYGGYPPSGGYGYQGGYSQGTGYPQPGYGAGKRNSKF